MPRLEQRRLFRVWCLYLACFLFLGGRLAWLSIWRGKELAAAAVNQRIQRLVIGNFQRGDIMDCHGASLLNSDRRWVVAVFPGEAAGRAGVPVSSGIRSSWQAAFCNDLLQELPRKAQLKKLRERLIVACSRKKPFLLPLFLDSGEAARLAEAALPGVHLISLPERYGAASLARHLIGCVEGDPLQGKAQRGVKGLEALYEPLLSPAGKTLQILEVVSRNGERLRGTGLRWRGEEGNISRGGSLQLTIDKNCQRLVEQVMDRYRVKGAVAVVDVPTGEVRALASRPNYDQGSGRGDQFDRALSWHHPGSVFKIVVAAAALSEGMVRPGEVFYCSGKYHYNDKEAVSCWKKGGHGRLTFQEALADSCNTVFVQVALRLGRERLEEYASKLGLEQGLGGYLGDWRGGRVDIGCLPGQLGNAALGQEGVLISPLNLAVLAGTIARGGIYIRPEVVQTIYAPQGGARRLFRPSPKRVLSLRVAEDIQQMLRLAVTAGTGSGAEVNGGSAGKTGSAETGLKDRTGKSITDAWFVGYAPWTTPRYALAVYVEGGGSGGDIPAGIFRDITATLLGAN